MHLIHIMVAVTGQRVIAAIEFNITLSTICSTTTGALHAEIFVIAINFGVYQPIWPRIDVLDKWTGTGNSRLRLRKVCVTSAHSVWSLGLSFSHYPQLATSRADSLYAMYRPVADPGGTQAAASPSAFSNFFSGAKIISYNRASSANFFIVRIKRNGQLAIHFLRLCSWKSRF